MNSYRYPALLFLCCMVILLAIALSCVAAPVQQQTQVSQPILACSPEKLNFTVKEGQVNVLDQVINISNRGGGVLLWTVIDNVRWIQETQASSVQGLQGGAISVVVDPSGMAAGEYTGVITIVADDALSSPCHVPVKLIVTSNEKEPVVTTPARPGDYPADSAVIWKNHTELSQNASTNSCIVSGSITNSEKWWYLNNVAITSSTSEVMIATNLPPGETIIYNRYIPCSLQEGLKLKYTWYKP